MHDGSTKHVDKATVLYLSSEFKRICANESAYLGDSWPLAIFCLRLYTQQDVDIDRNFLCPDVPGFPTDDDEQSPEGRDKVYAQYRSDPEKPRNPMMFQVANWATRRRWEKFMGSDVKSEDVRQAEDGLKKFIKWQCLISAVRQHLDEPITTYRGLCRLPSAMVQDLATMRRGSLLFWPAMTSTALDRSVAQEYANQPAPEGTGNVLFVISGVSEGIALRGVSQYPREGEFLLPLFSLLEVRDVLGTENPELRCKFVGSLMTEDFRQECLLDMQHAQQVCRVDGDATALLATARVQMPMMTSQGVHGSGMTLSLKGVGRRGAGSKQVGDIQLQLSWLRNITGSGWAAPPEPAALTIRPQSWPGGTNWSPLTAHVQMGPSPAVAYVAEAASASLQGARTRA